MSEGAAWKDVGPGATTPPSDAGGALPPPSPEATAGAPDAPKPDEKPSKRPTTRAGRRAAAEAKRLSTGAQGAKDSKPKASQKVPRRASLETRLAGSLTSLGTVVAVAGSANPAIQADGVAIVQHAPAVAAALDKVAKDDPRVAASLERMLTAGVWSGLVAALVPLAMTIAANHGAIPAHLLTLLGTEAPAPDAGTGEPAAPGTVPVV